MNEHIVLNVWLPTLWLTFTAVAVGFTVPLVLLRRSLRHVAISATRVPVQVDDQVRRLVAGVAYRDVAIRLVVLLSFVYFGVSGYGILPFPIARVASTIVFFLDNAMLGYKSYAEFRDITKALELTSREFR